MKALIVIAHGSRKISSNEEITSLCTRMMDQASPFEQIKPAFLELTEPSFDDVVNELATNGAKEIIVLPYFLAAGVHVSKDLPALLKNAQAEYPNLHFSLLPHLGSVPTMASWLLDFAADS